MRHSPSLSADRLDRDCWRISAEVLRETDEDRTDYRTLISDLLTGQYDHLPRVVAFNPLEGWSRDVEDVAHEQEKQINRDRHERGLPSLPRRRLPRATP